MKPALRWAGPFVVNWKKGMLKTKGISLRLHARLHGGSEPAIFSLYSFHPKLRPKTPTSKTYMTRGLGPEGPQDTL